VKKYLGLVMGLALLLVLVLPSAAMAQNISLDNAGSDYESNNVEWHFVINQIDGGEDNAPDSILVHWSNAPDSTIDRTAFSGKVAHYALPVEDAPEGAVPTGAEAEIYDGWDGRFVLSHGPTPPVPELPVVALMGLGLAAVGTVLFLKRRTLFPTLG
jgi:hypothetical protein